MGIVIAIVLGFSMGTVGFVLLDCDISEVLYSVTRLMESCGIELEGDNLFYCIDLL